MARGRRIELPDSEVARLEEYDWPGNVRELKNILERAMALREGPLLRPSELLGGPAGPGTRAAPAEKEPCGDDDLLPLKEIERRHVLRVLDSLSGNYARTARVLGVSLNTLKRKLRDYGLR